LGIGSRIDQPILGLEEADPIAALNITGKMKNTTAMSQINLSGSVCICEVL